MENQPRKEESSFRKWAPLIVLSLGLAVIIIDTTLLNVSLSYLIKDLNTDIQSLQWVITAYALVLAALTITGGRLGDLFGRKKMFVLGAAIFAIGSFLASISHNVTAMIMGESIIEGIGGALMMPATASLLVSTYRGSQRAIAMGVWGGIAAASSAIGPILGGYLTTNYSWRWGFRINIFVAAILIVGSLLVKECRDQEEKPTMDFLGVILSSVGLLGVVFGIIESSKYGWWTAKETFIAFGQNLSFHGYSIVPLAISIGIVFLVAFLIWERRVERSGNTPLVSLALFKNTQFSSTLIVVTMMAIGQAGIIFAFPVFFQSVLGLDALHTGLAFLPMSITALILAPLSAGLLSKKIPAKRLIQFGLLCGTAGLVYSRFVISPTAVVRDFAPALILYGAGIGLMMANLTNMAMSAVSIEQAGEASGVNNTVRQIGTSLGTAIIGAALLASLATNLTDQIAKSPVIPEALKDRVSQAASIQTSNIEFGQPIQTGVKLPAIVIAEIKNISHVATVNANKISVDYTIIFMILGFISSFWLTNNTNLEKNASAASKKSQLHRLTY